MKKEKKLIGVYKIKGISEDGNISRHYFMTFDNCTISVNQFILCKESYIEGFEPITTRFGKTLHKNAIAFKFETIGCLYYKLIDDMVKNNINPEDFIDKI